MSYSIRAVLCAVAVVACGDGMATDLTLRAAGLYTDPNPYSEAPAGALRQADNVVIRRAGVLEPRPGFRPEGLGGGDRYVGIHPAPTGDSSEYYVQKTTGLDDDTGGAVETSAELVEAITQTGEYAGAPVGRLYDRLYVPGNVSGIVAAVADSAARVSGLPRAGQPYVASTSTAIPAWLADTEGVAYRAVIVNDLGDRILVGPPSGRTVYRNDTGATVYPTLRIDVVGLTTAWVVQLYRSITVASGVEPSDELYLVAEHQVTSGDVANGYVTIRDTAEASDLGASLYTNATQQGALQENQRPPACEVTAAFNEMMFYGRITEPHRLVLGFRDLPNQGVPDPTVIGVTSGLATFTLAAGESPNEESIGQFIVTDPTGTVLANGAGLQNYTWIADDSPLTLSSNANATNAALTVTALDWIALDDSAGAWTTFALVVPYPSTARTNDLEDGTVEYGTSGDGPQQILSLIAASLEAQVIGVRVIATQGALILERPFAVDGAIEVRLPRRFASLIDATPAGNSLEAATSLVAATRAVPPSVQFESVQRVFVNRVFYSKKQEPEHVPPVNFVDIGADSEPIIAMRSTRRALFVFKTDGIWIIQGDTPETLRVEQIDSTARLLNPKAVAVGGDRVFAWTDAGVVMLSEGGIAANLSAPAIEPDLRDIQVALQATSDPASGSTLGCFLSYQDGEERLLLGVPAAVGDDMVDSVYVYDMRTQAWTRWTTGDREYSASTTIAGRVLFAGQTDAAEGDVWRETLASDEAPHADDTIDLSPGSLTIVSQTDDEVVVTGSFVVPVGAWVYQPSVSGDDFRGYVTTYTGGSPASMTITKLSGTLLVGGEVILAITAYEPVEQCIEWIAKTAQVPTATKHWQRGSLAYESDRRMYDATLSFRSDLVHTASSLTTEHTLHDDALPEDVPFMVTRDHARSAVLLPKLCISQAGARWALNALHLDYELGSSRVGRRAR